MRPLAATLLLVVAAAAGPARAHDGAATAPAGQPCVGDAATAPAGAGAEASPFARADVRAIAERITCYCGCPHLQVSKCFCGTADRIRADIAADLDAGRSPDEIIAAYVAEHGTWSLAEPPKSGFNWVAWLAAPVTLLLGGAAVLLAGRAWSRRQPAPAPVTVVLDPADEERHRAALRRAVDAEG